MTWPKPYSTRDISEGKITVLDVELVRDVADLQFVGEWQQEDGIAFDVQAGAAHFDAIIEASKIFAGGVTRGVNGEFRADLPVQLKLFEMKNPEGVGAFNLAPNVGQQVGEASPLGQIESQSIPARPG